MINPEIIKTMAPPKRLPICAKAISSIRFEADNTATLPVPPIELLQKPAVIADSTGYNPNRRPIKPAATEMLMTLTKQRTTNCQVKNGDKNKQYRSNKNTS